MEKYNYLESVKEDVRSWLDHDGNDFKADHANEVGVWVDNESRGQVENDLYDLLWDNDSITGNASGSYTCNAWVAEENICHNMDLAIEAWDALNPIDPDRRYFGSAEEMDVTIRCYLLPQAIGAVISDILGE